MSVTSAAITRTNNEFNAALAKTSGSNLDKDSFLLLLVTQFKYQDPLNPMEDKEFISQMSQFSSLEQLMNLNESMEGLTTATTNQQTIGATSYLGKQVTVSGNSIGKVTEGDTATITQFRYAPADSVAGGTITVRDAYNNVVYTEDVGAKSSGTTYTFAWNGRATDGSLAPDGVYTVNLSLLNAKGEAVLADQVVDAKVTGVVNDSGAVYLGLDGGQLMALANVRQVTEPTSTRVDATQTATAGSSGSNSSGSNSSSSTTQSDLEALVQSLMEGSSS